MAPARRAGAPVTRNSPVLVLLTGTSYCFVGLAFSYLDRSFGAFGFESILWLVWALLGFGAGAWNAPRPRPAGESQWYVMGLFGALVAMLLLLVNMYSIVRWAALALMIIVGARAATLATRRDFYLTLTGIFVVSFMLATHGNADWTLWFYLGPAWVAGALALSWDHSAGTRIATWIKLTMTFGFGFTAFVLAALLFFFAPRPPVLGFGFLPPGTDTPGVFKNPADGQRSGQPNTGAGDGASRAGSQGKAQQADSPGLAEQWRAMLGEMRQSLSSRSIPQWQRGLMQKMLDGAQAALDALTTKSLMFRFNWLFLLLLVSIATLTWLLWIRRYAIGMALLLGAAGLLASRFPARSIRLCAVAMKWCLHGAGHRRAPGQSVREHWAAAASGLAPLAARWLGDAVNTYCAMRFGAVAATAQSAQHMHVVVQGASDVLSGRAPELAR